jgi:phage repressor protein C with HTH and peptisase S24 domain
MTMDEKILIRRFLKSNDYDSYILASLNPHYSGNIEPVLYNIKVKSVAPIIWHRRLKP